MNLQQVVLSLGVFTTLLRDRCYGDEDTEHVHIKLHVPEIINKHVHLKTKYMHVYHPKKVVQEMPPSFGEQQPIVFDPNVWLPSSVGTSSRSSLTSMVQDKLSSQLAQELMLRYRNLDAPSMGGTSALRDSGESSDYLRDYYRQQRKLSDQLMLEEAMQLPNFAQTKYLSNVGYNWDKSFGIKSTDVEQPLAVRKTKKKKTYGLL